MMQEDEKERRYPGNSKASREQRQTPAEVERPRMKKVTKGEASLKKPLGRRIIETFSGDDAQTVGQYVLFDVLIPAVKDMIVDAGKEALERAFFGGGGAAGPRTRTSRSGSSFSYGTNNRTSYRSRYPGTNFDGDRDDRTLSSRSRSRSRGYEDVILETRGDAEEALDALREAIEVYHSVSVADLYDLVGAEHNYMDRSVGWTDLRDAEVRRLRSDQYMLDLPPAVRLD